MKKATPQILVADHLKQFINASISGRRLSASGKRISKGTIQNYLYAQKLVLEFEAKQSAPLRIQLLHRASMRTLQREKNYWARFYFQFSTFLYKEKGYFDNYVAGTFKIIKSFFNYLHIEKGYSIGSYHKSFRITVQRNNPIVLQPAQLQFLISDEAFIKSLDTSLKRARDIFVFGCTVALRVSDLMKLKKNNVIEKKE